MSLEHKDIKDMQERSYVATQDNREEGADDHVFYYLSQWDESYFQTSDLAYRGQFDLIKKAGRKVQADMDANPVQIDFDPQDETSDDAADLADGFYRAGTNYNISIEAFGNGDREQRICGFGAWR